ncbi:MAG: response regulator transcription factor [Chloroflexi bacterium]|nr:response regulator transcription factor [Chloroflexota bacterium]
MRVLLADDHGLFLEGMRNLLLAHDWEVVGTAQDGLEALAQARRLRPDVIFMDIEMPKCDGLAATRLIKAEMPEIQIVMLTMHEEDEKLFQAIKSGATGYLLKGMCSAAFLDLLVRLEKGEPPLAPGLTASILREFAGQEHTGTKQSQADTANWELLTPRQVEVLTLVAQGMTYKEVGEALCLSKRTVKYHIGQILQQLHLRNRAEVIAWAARSGLGVSS